jgi:hypothetical protein
MQAIAERRAPGVVHGDEADAGAVAPSYASAVSSDPLPSGLHRVATAACSPAQGAPQTLIACETSSSSPMRARNLFAALTPRDRHEYSAG